MSYSKMSVINLYLYMTWVTLCLKFDDAQEIKDYCPISMVGYVYKIISKVMSIRLWEVMDGLVGKCQSAYVYGHQILDGALIACETVQ